MGPMLLFTGYRSPSCDLYPEEKGAMVESGVLDYAFLALSRHPPVPKVKKLKFRVNSYANERVFF